MAIPVIFHVAVASQALPVVATLAARGRRPPAPWRQLSIMCLVFLFSDLLMLAVARLTGENLWVYSVSLPVEVALTLWLLSTLQPGERWAARYRWLIPVVLAIPAVLMVLPGVRVNFDRQLAPFLAISALAATLHTAVRRALLTVQRLTTESWFWLLCGMSLFWVQYVAIDAFTNAVLAEHADWALTAYIARASIIPIAFAIMAWAAWSSRTASRGSGSSAVPSSLASAPGT